MTLIKELGLKRGYKVVAHEALLNIYYTASKIKKRADEFFSQFGLTDVQFNVMSLLSYESQEQGGLSQAQLSDMMLVNRANITSLIDRMEKRGLVVRTAAKNDRRYNIVKLTGKGEKLFAEVEPVYIERIRQAMKQLNEAEQKKLIKTLEKIRSELS